MRVITLALVVIAILSGVIFGQEWSPRGRIVGSVEIPALRDSVNKGRPDAPQGAVTLYSQPDRASSPAAVITDRSQIASLEHDYEQVSAGVLAYRWAKGTRWYQVQYTTAERSGTVWLSESQAGRFRFLYDILHGGMAFLTDAWDGRLYKAPSHDAPHQTVSHRGERPDVAVAAAAGGPEKLWLLVVILDGNICEQASRSVMATGWVPAHSTSGRITVWHYSRGC